MVGPCRIGGIGPFDHLEQLLASFDDVFAAPALTGLAHRHGSVSITSTSSLTQRPWSSRHIDTSNCKNMSLEAPCANMLEEGSISHSTFTRSLLWPCLPRILMICGVFVWIIVHSMNPLLRTSSESVGLFFSWFLIVFKNYIIYLLNLYMDEFLFQWNIVFYYY